MQKLYLDSNYISHLPKVLLDLNIDIILDPYDCIGEGRKCIIVGNNPLIFPPVKTLEQGQQAIRSYLLTESLKLSD